MVRDDVEVQVFIRKADEALAQIGYTEHGERHVSLVAHIAYVAGATSFSAQVNELRKIGFDKIPSIVPAARGVANGTFIFSTNAATLPESATARVTAASLALGTSIM